MLLTAVAYFIRSFRLIQMIAMAALIILMLWAMFIDESVRWQLTHNREDAATATLAKALKINKKTTVLEVCLQGPEIKLTWLL